MKHRLRYLRDLHELNLKQFALKTGLKETTLSNYFAGTSVPSLAITEQIAKAFDVNPTWLAGWPEPKAKTVYVPAERIPPDWKNDEAGKLIKWTKRGVPVD
ncbi:helix-turn-helix domain-containing protein [Streptococcus uberis]|uniref:helix-turn-helix domain-containing protein n=1 Tax=Streptococcus uberis TaxID=1349 RepID=UPI00062044AD|nr:helix-turn-helix transcriptional regulator [Streptococcus uberis]KKF56975.1 XRE family transcriptional regulator [Streptococcus uberis 6736]